MLEKTRYAPNTIDSTPIDRIGATCQQRKRPPGSTVELLAESLEMTRNIIYRSEIGKLSIICTAQTNLRGVSGSYCLHWRLLLLLLLHMLF